MLRGLHHFTHALEARSARSARSIGPTTHPAHRCATSAARATSFPTDDEALEQLAGELETLLPDGADARSASSTSNAGADAPRRSSRKTVDYEGFQALDARIRASWKEAVGARPGARASSRCRPSGSAPLQAKISQHLVPTLMESFGLTVVIIFVTFLLVFRNGAARLMAMIPSLFAILVMFGVMRADRDDAQRGDDPHRLDGARHVRERSDPFLLSLPREAEGRAPPRRRCATRCCVAGRAIFFATLINAGGFLAFAMADLPPMRQFGILSALAFMLSMIADFTALPAALWMVFREKPEHAQEPEEVTSAAPDTRR